MTFKREYFEPVASDCQRMYEFYRLIHESNFSLSKKRSLMTAVLGFEVWSWRVTGISKLAAIEIANNDFKKPVGRLVRDHIEPRSKTYDHVFESVLSQEDWWLLVWKNDQTTLVTVDEHKQILDDRSQIFPIDPALGLFMDAPVAGFYFTKSREGAFVRDLIASPEFGEI